MQESISNLRVILNDTTVAAQSKIISYEEIAIAMLLNTLPSSYAVQRSILTDKKIETLNEVEEALIREEQNQKVAAHFQSGSSREFAGMAKRKRPFKVKSWGPNVVVCSHNWDSSTCFKCNPSRLASNSVCSDCGVAGHRTSFSDRCSKFSGSNGHSNIQHSANAAFEKSDDFPQPFMKAKFAGMVNHVPLAKQYSDEYCEQVYKAPLQSNDLRLIIDSGCTNSIKSNKFNLESYTEPPKPKWV